MRFLIKIVCDLLVKHCEKKGKVFKIIGGKNNDIYLVRYIVYKGRFGNIFIHRFLRSDADDPHDHPWDFWSYILHKGYVEARYDRSKPLIGMDIETLGLDGKPKAPILWYSEFWSRKDNVRKPGDLTFIRANDIHKVMVDKNRTIEEIKDAPYTICYMKPRIREWGFWPLEMKGSGFLDWREYLNIVPGDSRTEGSE